MFPRKSIIGFLCRLAVIYGLLIVPWPGWNDLYGQYFRALGQVAFTRDGQQRIVLFQPDELHHGFSSLDTRMVVGNRELAGPGGQGKAAIVALDPRSIGWVPTALTLALILATPVPWRRRGWALLWGLGLVHAFVLFTLQVQIWEMSPQVSLLTLTPFWARVLDELDYALLTQIGASFSVPVVIWVLVTFRREDGRVLKNGPTS